MTPWYRKHGKIERPLTEEEFKEMMEEGIFKKPGHRAFVVLLFYTGVRKTEALRSLREQYRITHTHIIFSVGKRLKHGKTTPALPLSRESPFIEVLVTHVESISEGARIFPFSPMTAWNICDRLDVYPHYLRLSAITNLDLMGWSLADIKSWTGLTVQSIDYYIGLGRVQKMGDRYARKVETKT